MKVISRAVLFREQTKSCRINSYSLRFLDFFLKNRLAVSKRAVSTAHFTKPLIFRAKLRPGQTNLDFVSFFDLLVGRSESGALRN